MPNDWRYTDIQEQQWKDYECVPSAQYMLLCPPQPKHVQINRQGYCINCGKKVV